MSRAGDHEDERCLITEIRMLYHEAGSQDRLLSMWLGWPTIRLSGIADGSLSLPCLRSKGAHGGFLDLGCTAKKRMSGVDE